MEVVPEGCNCHWVTRSCNSDHPARGWLEKYFTGGLHGHHFSSGAVPKYLATLWIIYYLRRGASLKGVANHLDLFPAPLENGSK
jgi:hypothetical protein